MYLHLGQEKIVTLDEIIGIFDLDTTTVSKVTRDYLTLAQKSGKVVTIGTDLPKSFILCKNKGEEHKVYISPISTATLQKRVDIKF